MSGFFNLKGLTGIVFGTRVINRVYQGGRLVWHTLQPHNFYTNTWFGPLTQSTWTTLHSHVVDGSGQATLRSEWLFNLVPIYTTPHLRAIRILRNGTQIGYWDHGGTRVMASVWHSSGTITNQELLDGDILTLQAYGSGNVVELRTLSNHGLTITPL